MSIKDRFDDDGKNESFASRWSRKKKAESSPPIADQAEHPEVPSIPLNTVLPSESTGRMTTAVEADRLKADQNSSDAPDIVLTDEDLPDVESLHEGSDFKGFMSPGVSDKLRKLALRKLFAGAGFNIRDGLDDYDEDFTNFEPLGDIVTCDMKHRAEVEEEKRQKAIAEAEAAEREAEEKALVENEANTDDEAGHEKEAGDNDLVSEDGEKEMPAKEVREIDQIEQDIADSNVESPEAKEPSVSS